MRRIHCLMIMLVTSMSYISGAELPSVQTKSTVWSLQELEQIALSQNPNLKQAEHAIAVAQGRHLQAGLYPNPTISIQAEELGSPQGKYGLITAPYISQQIVTAGKLELSRAVAAQRIDQAGLELIRRRFALLTDLRQRFFEALSLQQRVEVLNQLVDNATKALEVTKTLVEGKQAAPLDLIQLRAQFNQLRATLLATKQLKRAAWRRLNATVGVPHLPERPLTGSLTAPVPKYDYKVAQARMLQEHPEVLSAQVGVKRAQLSLERARAGAIPNVTVGAGYQRNDKDNENTWAFQVSVPVPIFNRNQGNIQAAHAQTGRAIQSIHRVSNDLVRRLARAFGDYEAALEQVELYRDSIIPDTTEAYNLTRKAYDGGRFGYLQVLAALRANQQANLKYIQSLSDLWQAVSTISGLVLELHWPLAGPQAKPTK